LLTSEEQASLAQLVASKRSTGTVRSCWSSAALATAASEPSLLPLEGETLPIGGLSAGTSYEASADARDGAYRLDVESYRAIAPSKLEPRRDG
jgi:hypothetical protein